MNVACPTCRSIFRVDPAKVPLGGIRASCAECQSAVDVPDTDGTDVLPLRDEGSTLTTDQARWSGHPRPSASEAMVDSDRAAAPDPDVATYGAMRPAVPPTRRSSSPVAPSIREAPVTLAAASTTIPPRLPANTGRVVNPFMANDPSSKAKRLARALVSDMTTYLPAKREEGLRDGTLKQLFREEIKKSYGEYVGQVGERMAQSTTYFQDALNEILAAGKSIF